MKKLHVMFYVFMLLSIHHTIQAQGLLGKLLNGSQKSSTSTNTQKEVKEMPVVDEPGTIYGNYYVKFLNSNTSNEYYVQKGKNYPAGQTIQLVRYKAGDENNILIGWGGTAYAAYSKKCRFSEYASAGGLLLMCDGIPESDRTDKPTMPITTNNDIYIGGQFQQLKEGVLALDCGYCVTLLSKDKSLLDAYPESGYQAVYDKLHKDYDIALANGDKGKAMPKQGLANKAPVFAKARTAAPAAFKQYLSDKGITNLEPVYAYDFVDHTSFNIIKDNLGHEIARTLQLYVVCKNNVISDSNKQYKHSYKTKYVVYLITIKETGGNNVFDGKYYCTTEGMAYPIMDTENALMYK